MTTILNGVIYEIRNTVTNKRYIGSTIQKPNNRFNSHRSLLRRNKHHSKHLQNSWNKYGEDKFEFNILEEISKVEFINDRHLINVEQKYLEEFKPEYNCTLFALAPLGFKHSNETIAKMKNRKFTNEHKEKIALANKNHNVSIETREKIRNKLKGENNFNYGKPLPEETRKKISKSNEKYIYKILSPDNLEFMTTNLSKFCQQYNLNISKMCEVANKNRNHHKQWKVVKL